MNNLTYLRDIVHGCVPGDPEFNLVHDVLEREGIDADVLACPTTAHHDAINACAAEIRMRRFQRRLFEGVTP